MAAEDLIPAGDPCALDLLQAASGKGLGALERNMAARTKALEAEAGLELGYSDPVRLVLGVAQGRGDSAVSEVYFLLGR